MDTSIFCQAYELFSHEADTGMVIPAASRLKNVEWDTQTALYCWASQGVWPPEADGTEVTLRHSLKLFTYYSSYYHTRRFYPLDCRCPKHSHVACVDTNFLS